MDVIYHQNCLDGAYSVYLMYLFAKCAPAHLLHRYFLACQHKEVKINSKEHQTIGLSQLIEYKEIDEEFFHKQCHQLRFRSIAMHAGELFPITPIDKKTVLFIVDISPKDKHTLSELCNAYQWVMIIEHHLSFQAMRKQIIEQTDRYKNLLYIWQQGTCAARLTLDFLSSNFGFLQNYPQTMREELITTLDYVQRNDLKKGENITSKQFVLGFYYFEIEMSHSNPWLFKRLHSMALATILKKGKNLYENHMKKLEDAIARSEIWRGVKGPFKDKVFLGARLVDRGLISDLGSILACLSVRLQYENLAIIYNKGNDKVRISTRSYQLCEKQPLALKLASYYNGGGHNCAAGCCLTRNMFQQHFVCGGQINKNEVKMGRNDIEDILFKIQ